MSKPAVELTARQCERILRDAGAPKAFARAVVTLGFRGAQEALSNRCDSEAGVQQVVEALKRVTTQFESMTKENTNGNAGN